MKKFAISMIVLAAIDVIVAIICGCKAQMAAMGWAFMFAGVFACVALILLGLNKLRERNMGW